MKDPRTTFAGKKITVMGLGLLGRAISDIAFLARAGAELLVTDLKSAEELAPSLEKLAAYPSITYRLGGHRFEDFENADMILKAQAAPLDSPFLERARSRGVPIQMSASLFAELAQKDVRIVGVTGTRGKTTTAALIHGILSSVARPDFAKAEIFLGGNVRGGEGLALLEKVSPGDTVVLELDSWQLQGFGESRISPHLAVFTTFLTDHMNYYVGSMERYFADKANIFAWQTKKDALIVGSSAQTAIECYFTRDIPSRVIAADSSDLPSEWNLRLVGEHNRANAALAMRACEWLGVLENDLRSGIEGFGGVEGRLQRMGEKDGVPMWNDNNATTPDATIAALRALGSSKRDIILIMGGSDKGLDMRELLALVPVYCKSVVAYPGTGTARVIEALRGMRDVHVFEVETLRGAFAAARSAAAAGDAILFSPAFASFGKEFKNEYDRNDQFVRLVREL